MTATAAEPLRELHGRDAERSALAALLAGARDGRSEALVLRGSPGVGKTALLDDAIARADGLRVLRAVGAEPEASLAFAGLHQLLLPVLDLADALPAPQARAVRQALGVEAGGAAPEPLLLGAGVLGVLAEAAPVVVVVDDAHRFDEPSMAALAFAGRRVNAEGIALLAAVREDAPPTGLPERTLGPLDPTAATGRRSSRSTSTAPARSPARISPTSCAAARSSAQRRSRASTPSTCCSRPAGSSR